MLNEREQSRGRASGGPKEAPGGRRDSSWRGLEGHLWLRVWGEHRKVRVAAPPASQATLHLPPNAQQPPHKQAHYGRPTWPWGASSNSPACPRFPELLRIVCLVAPPRLRFRYGQLRAPLSKNGACRPQLPSRPRSGPVTRPGPSSEAPVCLLCLLDAVMVVSKSQSPNLNTSHPTGHLPEQVHATLGHRASASPQGAHHSGDRARVLAVVARGCVVPEHIFSARGAARTCAASPSSPGHRQPSFQLQTQT